jgi:hypothetical protein
MQRLLRLRGLDQGRRVSRSFRAFSTRPGQRRPPLARSSDCSASSMTSRHTGRALLTEELILRPRRRCCGVFYGTGCSSVVSSSRPGSTVAGAAIASRKFRRAEPSPRPASGSRLGPRTRRAIRRRPADKRRLRHRRARAVRQRERCARQHDLHPAPGDVDHRGRAGARVGMAHDLDAWESARRSLA